MHCCYWVPFSLRYSYGTDCWFLKSSEDIGKILERFATRQWAVVGLHSHIVNTFFRDIKRSDLAHLSSTVSTLLERGMASV